MKTKMNIRLCILFLLALVLLLPSVSAFYNISYTYYNAGGDVMLADGWTDGEKNVTLPEISWDVYLKSDDDMFEILLEDINHSYDPTFNIEAREVTGAELDEFETNNAGYDVQRAFAFNISEYVGRPYKVLFDYTGISNPALFKCPYDFVSDDADTTNCEQLSTADAGSLKMYASTTNFSIFFLTEDQTAAVSPPSGPSGSGGGGGGGGDGEGKIVYVTPTEEGETVTVYSGDELIVIYDEEEYHFRVTKVGSTTTQLKNLATYYVHEIEIGENFRLGLESFFADDVRISMHITNKFAMLTFRISPRRTSLFSLLPPRPRTTTPVEAPSTPRAPPTATAPTPAPTPEPEPVQELQMPESPITLWTIIAAIVFVALLVGGVALYRYRLHNLAKPPTVTRAGLPPSAESTSTGAAPVHLSSEEKLVIEKPEPEELPYMKLNIEQKLELEKFVFHALSQGFNDGQIRDALIKKGWPEGNVEEVMKEVMPKKAG
jgi:hypothetical protein